MYSSRKGGSDSDDTDEVFASRGDIVSEIAALDEAFESDEIAQVLNTHFVPIKVDREERPDIDRVYMAFVQATTGSGGWPMSVWLTPDLKPFYGGTYFPPSAQWGRPGFVEILTEISRNWRESRDRLVSSANGVIERLRESYDWVLIDSPPAASLADTTQLVAAADMVVLVVQHYRTDRDMVRKTLQRLQAIQTPIVGAVLNNVDFDRAYHKDYYYAGYYYAEEYGSDKRKKNAKDGVKVG